MLLDNITREEIEFLGEVNNHFKFKDGKGRVLLINKNNNYDEPLGFIVDSVDTKRNLLHFALDNNYVVPNVYISDLIESKLYYKIYP